MKLTWLIVASAGAMVSLQACGGQSFSVLQSDGSVTESGVVGGPDATQEGATEAGPESGPSNDATTDDASDAAPVVDSTIPDAPAATDGAPEASAADAPPTHDAEWMPDVIEPAPAHCDNGFACTPSPPDGWSGPLEVYSGPTPPAACSPNFEGPVFVGGTAAVGGPATCGCTCGGSAGVGCAAVDVPFFSGLTCPMGGACAQETFAPAVCTHNDAASQCDAGTTSMIIPLSAATGGMCLPVPTKTVPPPTWGVDVRACVSGLAGQASDCAAGEVCSYLPLPPFVDVCIAEMGVVAACPPGRYSSRRIYTQSFDDSRDCSACTCGPVTGATCTSELDVFAATSDPAQACAGPAQTIYLAPEGCSFVAHPSDIRLKSAVESTGTCSPSPVVATGALVGAQATTFCCLP